MMAQVCGLAPGEFIHTFGDAHLYSNHFEQARLQLTREPRALPQMQLNPEVQNLFDFRFEDFELQNYDPHPHIKAQVAVWYWRQSKKATWNFQVAFHVVGSIEFVRYAYTAWDNGQLISVLANSDR